MKTFLSFLIPAVLLTGCYTQFSGAGSATKRMPDLTKVETRVDDKTTVTDYYDNRSYSRYIRDFGYGFGYRYYDRYGYDPYLDFVSTYNTNGWGYSGYIGFDYGYGCNYNYGYYNPYQPYFPAYSDYLTYRMDLWYLSRFGHYPGYSYYPDYRDGYNPGIANEPKESGTWRRRESRRNVLAEVGSTTLAPMPVEVAANPLAGGAVQSSFPAVQPVQNGRVTRQLISPEGTPVVVLPSSAPAATSILSGNSVNSGRVTRTVVSPESGSSPAAPPSTVQANSNPSEVSSSGRVTRSENSQPVSPAPVQQEAKPAPAPSAQPAQPAPSHRRSSRGRG